MITTFLNLILIALVYNFFKEKNKEKIVYIDKPIEKIVYVDKPVDKIVYVDRPVEKIVYKDKIVEKVVYKDKPVTHKFVVEKEQNLSPERKELLDTLAELKAKKKKSKKDLDNIYTIEKVLPNIK